MDVTVWREDKKYALHFEKGENIGGLTHEDYKGRRTGTLIRWRADLDVFTDIDIPTEYFTDMLKRQAVVNAGITFRFRDQKSTGGFDTTDFLYPDGLSITSKSCPATPR